MKAALVVMAGCWTTSAPSAPLENKPAPSPGRPPFVLDEHGLSPLGADTVVTQEALAKALPNYEVAPEGEEVSLVYDVRDRGELLFYVVPTGEAMFGIHVKSPRIPERPHGWRVGAEFHDLELVDTCECWGDQEDVQVCFKFGQHVAVLFERSARGLGCSKDPKGIAGARIDRLVWKPRPWGGG